MIISLQYCNVDTITITITLKVPLKIYTLFWFVFYFYKQYIHYFSDIFKNHYKYSIILITFEVSINMTVHDIRLKSVYIQMPHNYLLLSIAGWRKDWWSKEILLREKLYWASWILTWQQFSCRRLKLTFRERKTKQKSLVADTLQVKGEILN